MYESRHMPLLPRAAFLRRMAGSATVGFALIALSLWAGMLGYHVCEHQSWLDAFINAAMILSGMGPLLSPQTAAGKVFAGIYALYSGFALIMITAITFSPLVHRILHRFHLEARQRDE
jgi:hypothetical protein